MDLTYKKKKLIREAEQLKANITTGNYKLAILIALGIATTLKREFP